MEIYPWQKDPWATCCQRIQQDRFPNAWLLQAAAGYGLERFAKSLAKTCLCQARTKRVMPCDRCSSCRLFNSGNHPDIVSLSGTGVKASIKIEHIRDTNEFVHNSSHLGSYRIVLINEAENMTVQAANSLLKNLEEPPAKCLFFLTTYWPSRLLPTIRSRCQTVRIAIPPQEQIIAWLAEEVSIGNRQAKEWLELHNNRPLDALRAFRDQVGANDEKSKKNFFIDVQNYLKNPALFLPTVEKWHKQKAELIHRWLLEILSKAIEEQAERNAGTPQLNYLYRLYDRQSMRYRQLGNNLNARLQLEGALSEWATAAALLAK